MNVWPVVEFNQKDEEGNIIGKIPFVCRDSSKIDETMEIIGKTEDQVVVFSTFNEPMREIQRRCQELNIRCEMISSDTKKSMGTYETDFQQGKIRVLCINNAMGEGLNLQKFPKNWPGGASVVITLDRWWNSARNDQCISRVHRQGASEPVFVYHLYVKQSVDYFVLDVIKDKDSQFDPVMESQTIRPASEWKKYLKDLM